MFKTDKKTRNYIKLTSLPRDKIPNATEGEKIENASMSCD